MLREKEKRRRRIGSTLVMTRRKTKEERWNLSFHCQDPIVAAQRESNTSFFLSVFARAMEEPFITQPHEKNLPSRVTFLAFEYVQKSEERKREEKEKITFVSFLVLCAN